MKRHRINNVLRLYFGRICPSVFRGPCFTRYGVIRRLRRASSRISLYSSRISRVSDCVLLPRIHVRIARVSDCVFRWRISDRVLNLYLHLYLGSCIGDVYYERIRRVLLMRMILSYFSCIIACIPWRVIGPSNDN